MWHCGQLYIGQLYIVSVQNRYGDLAEFLAHEIQSFPHSLSNFGKFNLPSTESDLLTCLELPGQPEPPLTHDCKITDRAVIVHCLSTSVTSHAYGDAIFFPYIENQLQSVTRLDVAWDIDTPDSLNESTPAERQGCSQWTRRNFAIPKVGQFSCLPANAGQVVVSIGESIHVQNCNHEKEDTMIVVHVLHALKQGEQTIYVHTIETDVVVIIAGMLMVATQHLDDIWLAFGMGKNDWFYHFNAIC